MPGHGGENFVGILGIDGEFWNLLAVAQAKMGPGLAGVSGFVNAIADGEIRPMQPFAAADVNDIGIRRRDGNRADGAGGFVIKDRLPGAPIIVRLPDAAVADANIEDAGFIRHAADGTSASATVGADVSPLEGTEQRGIKLSKGAGLGLRCSIGGVAIGPAMRSHARFGRGLGHLNLTFGFGGSLLGMGLGGRAKEYERTDNSRQHQPARK